MEGLRGERIWLLLEHKELSSNWKSGGGNSWGSGVAQAYTSPIITINAYEVLAARTDPQAMGAITILHNTQPSHIATAQTDATIKIKGPITWSGPPREKEELKYLGLNINSYYNCSCGYNRHYDSHDGWILPRVVIAPVAGGIILAASKR